MQRRTLSHRPILRPKTTLVNIIRAKRRAQKCRDDAESTGLRCQPVVLRHDLGEAVEGDGMGDAVVAPVVVVAMQRALTMASSVASTAPAKIREISEFGNASTGSGSASIVALDVAVAGREGEEEIAAAVAVMPPTRARPSVARCASRLHWCGKSGASVATMTMIEPSASSRESWRMAPRRTRSRGRRDAVDAQLGAKPVVGLDEHADGPVAGSRWRRRVRRCRCRP